MIPTLVRRLITLALFVVAPSFAATTEPTTAAAFPTFGVDFTPPAAWQRQREIDYAIMTHWQIPADADAALDCIVSPTGERTPASAAAEEIKQSGGTAQDSTLDGLPAVIVQSPDRHSAALFCDRHGNFFQVRYRRTTGFNPAELEAVRVNWRWTKEESPAAHTELETEPLPLLKGLTIRLPGCFRPDAKPPAGHADFYAFDYQTSKMTSECKIDVSIPDGFGKLPLDKVATLLGKNVARSHGLDHPVRWTEVGHNALASETIPSAKGKATRWGLVSVDPSNCVAINFIFSGDPAHFDALSTMADKIIASVAKP